MTTPAFELDPPPRTWNTLIDFDPNRHASDRAALGLPTDRPIVMAGHQGGFWHAGIAAKLFAAHAIADRIGGSVAWLVVDTDDTQPTSLRVPLRDEQGRLTDRTIRIDRDTLDDPRAIEAAAAFDRHAREPSAEVRATLATMDRLPVPDSTLIRSSKLADTPRFRELVELFRTNTAGARAAYNEAVESEPAARITPLLGDAVPFWRVTPRGARLPAREADLAGPLWPRALATTGVVRASLCDLFIHGTGGRAYEPINNRWLGQSLGWPLAPFVTATANLRLRFEGDAATEHDAARAAWLAHHARHHPLDLGDQAGQSRRDALVQAIAQAPRESRERAHRFAELHAVLDEARTTHAQAISRLDAEARTLRARAAERSLRDDRTWPAVLHSPEALIDLRDIIAASFDAPPSHPGDS